MKTKKLAILLITASMLAACAMAPSNEYSGPERPLGKVAVIKSDAAAFGASAFINFIDRNGTRNRNEVRILPGRHELGITVKEDGYLSTSSAQIDAKAGHTYAVHGKIQRLSVKPLKGRVWVWVTDEENGALVGGEKYKE